MSADDVSGGLSIKHILGFFIVLLAALLFFVFGDEFKAPQQGIVFPAEDVVLYENESIPVYISGHEGEDTYFISLSQSGAEEPIATFESKISVLDPHTYAADLGVLEAGTYRLDMTSSASDGKVLDSTAFNISNIPQAEISLVSMRVEGDRVFAELSAEARSPEKFDIHSIEWALEDAGNGDNLGANYTAVLPARAGDFAGLVFVADAFGGRAAVDFTLRVPPINALLGGQSGLLFQQGQTPPGETPPVKAPLPCDCKNMAINVPNPIAPAAGAALPQSSIYCFGPKNVIPSMCTAVPAPPGPAGPGIPPAVAPGCPAGLTPHTCTIGWGGLLAVGPQSDQLSHGFEVVATLAKPGTQNACTHGQLAQMDHIIAFTGKNPIPLPNLVPGKAAPANPLNIPAGVTNPGGNPFPARAINFSPVVPSRKAQPIPRVTWAGDNYTSTANILVEYRNNIIRWYDAPTSARMGTGNPVMQLDQYDTDDAFLSYVLGSGNGRSCWCQHRHFYSWDRTKNPQLQGIFMVKTSGLRCP